MDADVYVAVMEAAVKKGLEFNTDCGVEIQTEKSAVKAVPCVGCGRPLIVNTFYAPALARCSECKGDGTSSEVVAPVAGQTDPAKVADLTQVLINKHFAKALCPVQDPIKRERIAWLAGLLEGEGSFMLKPNAKQPPIPCVQLAMTDRDVVVTAADLMGAKDVRTLPIRGTMKKPQYQADVRGHPALDVLRAVLPYLGERRSAKANELIDSDYAHTCERQSGPRADLHPMELKSVTHSDHHGPSEFVGYVQGRAQYRQLAKGETVMHQCLKCRATVSYSTTAQIQFRRQNEPRNGGPAGTLNEMADFIGMRPEEEE